MKIDLKDSGLVSFDFEKLNEDDMLSLGEWMGEEYGGGFVIGNGICIVEGYNYDVDGVKKDVEDFIKSMK